MRNYGRLSALGSDVMRNGADFEPTEQQVEVHGVLQGRLDEARRLYRLLFGEDLPLFNATVTERGQPAIIS